MNDEELKKIIEDVIGNNDPYWNVPVYEIVKKIINLPEGTESTIVKLLDNNSFNSKQLFDIYLSVNKVCNKINIKLDSSKNNAKVYGLPYNIPFIIKHLNKGASILKCPICGERLMLVSDEKFQCNRCNKYFKNNSGLVGEETIAPYLEDIKDDFIIKD